MSYSCISHGHLSIITETPKFKKSQSSFSKCLTLTRFTITDSIQSEAPKEKKSQSSLRSTQTGALQSCAMSIRLITRRYTLQLRARPTQLILTGRRRKQSFMKITSNASNTCGATIAQILSQPNCVTYANRVAQSFVKEIFPDWDA